MHGYTKQVDVAVLGVSAESSTVGHPTYFPVFLSMIGFVLTVFLGSRIDSFPGSRGSIRVYGSAFLRRPIHRVDFVSIAFLLYFGKF